MSLTLATRSGTRSGRLEREQIRGMVITHDPGSGSLSANSKSAIATGYENTLPGEEMPPHDDFVTAPFNFGIF